MTISSAHLSPRARRTRQALLSAGLDLLATRPVEAIAIDELVTAAGVAKGSFFNHFADKTAFAEATAGLVRAEVEAAVARINHGVSDPLARLAGGIIVAGAHALSAPGKAMILARSTAGHSPVGHPVNHGLLGDIRAGVSAGVISVPSEGAAVLYWLGCCQALIAALAGRSGAAPRPEALIADLLALGLAGLGADPAHAARVIEAVPNRLDQAVAEQADQPTA